MTSFNAPRDGSLLVLGGARSGKSARAQTVAEHCRAQQVFIATAEALDDEMRQRIARHVADRGDSWVTIESPIALSDAIAAERHSNKVLLVDCLTVWLSNIMMQGMDPEAEILKLVDAISATSSPLILVSNEVGMGIVPDNALGREFRDTQGRLNQSVAAVCDTVEFVAAGLPIRLKG